MLTISSAIKCCGIWEIHGVEVYRSFHRDLFLSFATRALRPRAFLFFSERVGRQSPLNFNGGGFQLAKDIEDYGWGKVTYIGTGYNTNSANTLHMWVWNAGDVPSATGRKSWRDIDEWRRERSAILDNYSSSSAMGAPSDANLINMVKFTPAKVNK